MTAECQMVTLPQKAALALLPELNDEAKIEAAFAKLQGMIERGEATLVANLVAKAKDGEKGYAESVEEFRYATEFDPPQVPTAAIADKPELLKDWPVVGVTPTAFETRNIGAILEIETTWIGDGGVLSVNVAPQHTRFLRWTRFDAGRLANGEHLSVEQPQFSSAKNTCSLLLRNGQRVVIGVHKLADAATETIEIFLLKVSAVAAP